MGTVQLRARDLADRLVQFASTARGGHLPGSDVVGEVDVAVLPPHRVMELERNANQLVAERFKLGQALLDHLTKLVDAKLTAVRFQLDHGDLDRVHVHIRRLAIQQHRVPAAEPFHHSPLLIGRPYNWQARLDNLFCELFPAAVHLVEEQRGRVRHGAAAGAVQQVEAVARPG